MKQGNKLSWTRKLEMCKVTKQIESRGVIVVVNCWKDLPASVRHRENSPKLRAQQYNLGKRASSLQQFSYNFIIATGSRKDQSHIPNTDVENKPSFHILLWNEKRFPNLRDAQRLRRGELRGAIQSKRLGSLSDLMSKSQPRLSISEVRDCGG